MKRKNKCEIKIHVFTFIFNQREGKRERKDNYLQKEEEKGK